MTLAATAVALVAARYDDEEGALTAGALRRLAQRQASAGKRCGSCGELLPTSAFGAEARRPDGLKASCRPCLAAAASDARARRAGGTS